LLGVRGVKLGEGEERRPRRECLRVRRQKSSRVRGNIKENRKGRGMREDLSRWPPRGKRRCYRRSERDVDKKLYEPREKGKRKAGWEMRGHNFVAKEVGLIRNCTERDVDNKLWVKTKGGEVKRSHLSKNITTNAFIGLENKGSETKGTAEGKGVAPKQCGFP